MNVREIVDSVKSPIFIEDGWPYLRVKIGDAEPINLRISFDEARVHRRYHEQWKAGFEAGLEYAEKLRS